MIFKRPLDFNLVISTMWVIALCFMIAAYSNQKERIKILSQQLHEMADNCRTNHIQKP